MEVCIVQCLESHSSTMLMTTLLQGVCISDCCNTMKIRSQVSSLTELWICIMIYFSLVDQAPAHDFINPSNA
jgi:hypothetical protein